KSADRQCGGSKPGADRAATELGGQPRFPPTMTLSAGRPTIPNLFAPKAPLVVLGRYSNRDRLGFLLTKNLQGQGLARFGATQHAHRVQGGAGLFVSDAENDVPTFKLEIWRFGSSYHEKAMISSKVLSQLAVDFHQLHVQPRDRNVIRAISFPLVH